jgi:hypothetical protein
MRQKASGHVGGDRCLDISCAFFADIIVVDVTARSAQANSWRIAVKKERESDGANRAAISQSP